MPFEDLLKPKSEGGLRAHNVTDDHFRQLVAAALLIAQGELEGASSKKPTEALKIVGYPNDKIEGARDRVRKYKTAIVAVAEKDGRRIFPDWDTMTLPEDVGQVATSSMSSSSSPTLPDQSWRMEQFTAAVDSSEYVLSPCDAIWACIMTDTPSETDGGGSSSNASSPAATSSQRKRVAVAEADSHWGAHILAQVEAGVDALEKQLAALPVADPDLQARLAARRRMLESLKALCVTDLCFRTMELLSSRDVDAGALDRCSSIETLASGAVRATGAAGAGGEAPSGEVDVLIVVCSPARHALPQAAIEANAIVQLVHAAGRTCLVTTLAGTGAEGGAVELNAEMMARAPRVVCFIGHGDAPHPAASAEGAITLGLLNATGAIETIFASTLADIFGNASRRLELLVLNGCSTEMLCESVTRQHQVPAVGWSTQAADVAAKTFSISLFGCLARHLSERITATIVREAFEHGKRAVQATARRRAPTGESSDAWELTDPKTSRRASNGRFAAGIPVLLLPPLYKGGVPPLALHLLPKLEEMRAIRSALASGCVVVHGNNHAGVVVHGMGGLGKTMLLACLVHEPATHGAVCPDGALWVQFSEDTNALDGLKQALSLLADLCGGCLRTADTQDIAAAKKALARLLETRRVLIVADDVWRAEQVAPLNEVVKNSHSARLLVSSRNSSIVDELGATAYALQLLQGDEALALMSDWAGRALADVKGNAEAMEVAAWCGVGNGKMGGLPLALRAVGSLAKRRRWDQVLALLKASRCSGQDVGPRGGRIDADYHPYEAQYAALFGALRASFDDLPEVERERCATLAIFMEDEDIPPEILQRLWQVDAVESTETIVMLIERSLIIEGGAIEGFVRLHDLQREFLQRDGAAQVGRWHAELLRRCGVPEIPAPSGPLFFRYWTENRFLHHLSHAGFDGTDGAVGDLALVESLTLRHCKALPEAIGKMASLKKVVLDGCSGLTVLPESLGVASLERLSLSMCRNLLELPKSLDTLTTLKSLNLRGCTCLIEVSPSLERCCEDADGFPAPVTANRNAIAKDCPEMTLENSRYAQMHNGGHVRGRHLLPGKCVRLVGLTGKPELNGQKGVITKQLKDGRFGVRLENAFLRHGLEEPVYFPRVPGGPMLPPVVEPISVKSQNLQRLDPAEESEFGYVSGEGLESYMSPLEQLVRNQAHSSSPHPLSSESAYLDFCERQWGDSPNKPSRAEMRRMLVE